eukprot:TRINITY_DN3527_c0_g1_i5.p1 TRINITY_DN3527_c0_g1~~TRINITY_DN3527_c0_g1_i5.p1  ORF type:complete len:434 (+),score=67.61 TRINITY_DN3527_c0_g1_i5:135-1436(+)
MSSPSSSRMLFEYPNQFTAFSLSEHSQFLHFVQQQIFSNALFVNCNEHTLPEINGRSTDEIIAHAKVWINSLISCASLPATINPKIDINEDCASSSTSNDEATKKRKMKSNVVQTPQYALEFLPYHVLQDIRSYLPLPYSYFFRLTCKSLYFVDKATKSNRSKKWHSETISPTICCAELALNGHLSCLRFFREREVPLEWNYYTTRNAVKGGHLECLKYAMENGCKSYNDLTSHAADGGHLEILKFLHEKGLEWDKTACSNATHRGYLECLQYLHENGCEWDDEICSKAALGGHFECLKYAHENGCKLDRRTLMYSFHGGHLDCVKYAYEHGLKPQKQDVHFIRFKPFHQDCAKYLCERIDDEARAVLFQSAVQEGSLECVKFLVENEYPLPELNHFILWSIHVECLKYLRDKGYPLNKTHLLFLEKVEKEQK